MPRLPPASSAKGKGRAPRARAPSKKAAEPATPPAAGMAAEAAPPKKRARRAPTSNQIEDPQIMSPAELQA